MLTFRDMKSKNKQTKPNQTRSSNSLAEQVPCMHKDGSSVSLSLCTLKLIIEEPAKPQT